MITESSKQHQLTLIHYKNTPAWQVLRDTSIVVETVMITEIKALVMGSCINSR